MENDLIIWFDNKTGNKIKEAEYKNLINELTEVVNKYGFDFFMSSNPIRMKQFLLTIKDV